MEAQIAKRRVFAWISGLLAILASATVYLSMTGESGLAQQSLPTRPHEVTRLDAKRAEGLGWRSDGLDAVFGFVTTLSTDSFVIVTNGEVVGAYGDLRKQYSTHSMRKSFLSALVGMHLVPGAGQVNLNATLEELGIDDAPEPLIAKQKQATVRHLLKSVSGISHPTAASGSLQDDIDRRLGNRENEPGTIWAYNNWDYNALTTIFEMRTGLGIAEAFHQGIAVPSEMEDFDVRDVSYVADASLSMHKAAAFRMSARDLVRFGQIYLNNGRIGDRQIVPSEWINRITEDFIQTGMDGLRWGHGYLWWIPSPDTGLPEGTFWSWGLGNQALFVVPEWNTLIVHQSDTTEFLKRFVPMIEQDGMEGEAAVEHLILSCLEPDNRDSAYCTEHRFTTRREFDKLNSLIVKARN
ncbi:serine hydrolase [Ruegeria sp. HKCCD8929]|uniref:serine hydrolase domain-containing protein n=1 Tax=Ruegeria sp. HKCCD8929 TaxID=2683006 RepID=UPI001488D22C|nr:serine hydrolase [Ruegeria sp. HKCCD8929]